MRQDNDGYFALASVEKRTKDWTILPLLTVVPSFQAQVFYQQAYLITSLPKSLHLF
jgi:hypothetical protein